MFTFGQSSTCWNVSQSSFFLSFLSCSVFHICKSINNAENKNIYFVFHATTEWSRAIFKIHHNRNFDNHPVADKSVFWSLHRFTFTIFMFMRTTRIIEWKKSNVLKIAYFLIQFIDENREMKFTLQYIRNLEHKMRWTLNKIDTYTQSHTQIFNLCLWEKWGKWSVVIIIIIIIMENLEQFFMMNFLLFSRWCWDLVSLRVFLWVFLSSLFVSFEMRFRDRSHNT